MRRWTILFLIPVALGLIVGAGAAQQKPKMPAPQAFDQGKDSPGKVSFDHDKHWEKNPKCTDCHTKVFKMKKGTTEPVAWKMATMNKGQSCGTCHDGTKAFSVKVEAECAKCHKKA